LATGACDGGKNSSSGPGVLAQSASGYGVTAKTTTGTAAILAQTPSTSFSASAILGQSTKNAEGVKGTSLANTAVEGSSTNSDGVDGINSKGGTGVYGQGGSFGLYASTPSGGISAIYALGASVDGAQIYSDSTRAIYAQNGCGGGCVNSSPVIEAVSNGAGEGVQSFTSGQLAGRFENNGGSPQGDGVEIYGQYIGLISRAPAGTGTYPFVLTDLSNNDLFFVDGAGDVYYHGSLNNFARTRDGNYVKSFGATSTTPSIEDNGTARLTLGVAQVALNPAFARAIDGQRPYQVMLTPDGDTRGLYIAQKTPTFFTVREVQGGHSSIAFDYHVYATQFGYAGVHMTEMTPSFRSAVEPHVKITHVTARPRLAIKLPVRK
jgi:hypothetical protein